MALQLKKALRAAVGESLPVSHTGPDGVLRTITVPVRYKGVESDEPMPAVYVLGATGDSDIANIGGDADENETFLELHIMTLDSSTELGTILLEDIHDALIARLRAVRKAVGNSDFTFASAFRDDDPEEHEGLPYSYLRSVQVRGTNHEKYA